MDHSTDSRESSPSSALLKEVLREAARPQAEGWVGLLALMRSVEWERLLRWLSAERQVRLDRLLHHPDPVADTANRAVIHFIDSFIEGGIASRNADLERANKPSRTPAPFAVQDDGTMSFDGLDE